VVLLVFWVIIDATLMLMPDATMTIAAAATAPIPSS